MFDKGNCCFSSNIIVLYELYASNWRGVLQVERLFIPRLCWFFFDYLHSDAFYNANARHRPLYEDARYFPLFLLGGLPGLTVRQRNVVHIDIRTGLSGSLNPYLADIIGPATHCCFCSRGHLKHKPSLNLFPWQSRDGKPKQVWKIISCLYVEGHAAGGAVGWGTALQAWKLAFFVDLFLPFAL
jgi:hypothetical protein